MNWAGVYNAEIPPVYKNPEINEKGGKKRNGESRANLASGAVWLSHRPLHLKAIWKG